MTDINLNFRPQFDDLCAAKKNFGICQASAFIESLNLKERPLDQQVLILREEKELQQKRMDDFERKEYLNFINNEYQLYNVYIAYLLFYHRNEEAILEECFILKERYKLLSQLLLETIAQLPLFTYADLLNNKKNVVFDELNQQPFGTSDEEYSRMRNWQTNQKIPPDAGFEQLFDLTFEEGISQSKKKIAEYKNRYPRPIWPEAKYHSAILHEQNKIRLEFKMLVYPEYYRFLSERENVKRIFLNNCILNIDIEDHQLELIKTIVLNEKNKFIDNELFLMDEEIICNTIDFDFIVHQMNDILSMMVPDSDLIVQWQNFCALASVSIVGRRPILFIIEDLVESFEWVYRQAVKKLQKLFYYQSSERKATYIIHQIRDLEYMKSNIPRKGPSLVHIIVDLNKHFRTDLENIRLQGKHKLAKMNDLLSETQILIKKKYSFGLRKSPELLIPIVQALNDNFNFLDPLTTT